MFLFFNDPATTEIYTLSLHDALPILTVEGIGVPKFTCETLNLHEQGMAATSTTFLTEGTKVKVSIAFPRSLISIDRKSTRLNSSHVEISYAVFCLKKKKLK